MRCSENVTSWSCACGPCTKRFSQNPWFLLPADKSPVDGRSLGQTSGVTDTAWLFTSLPWTRCLRLTVFSPLPWAGT